MNTPDHFQYGTPLSIRKAIQLAKAERKGVLSAAALAKIEKSRSDVLAIVESGRTVYGINTGFGPLCNTLISKKDAVQLQENILRSHSVGVGEPISVLTAQLMLVLKVQSLAKGFSGIQPNTLERILWHIEHQVTPEVPSQGSVGASGDLAPLAHLFLPLIGLGKVQYQGQWMETGEMFQKTGLSPVQLGPKEGLALINGTQFIAAHAVQVVERLHNCLEVADIIGAMSLEGLQGSIRPFEAELHQIRPFAGSQLVAHRLRVLLQSSEIVEGHINCERVQDPYSLRCMPPVHGASRNAWLHLKELTEIEINSVTDNPIVLDAGNSISGGNFHGQPLAMPLDYAALAASEIGNISDRRTYLLLEGKYGLPKLLMRDTGLYSGFMIPQYTAAALVSENKSLCYPASADSIPTSLGQEDHVSMGSISGRKALQIIGNLENILAIELLCAAQAMDYRRPFRSGKVLDACHELVRKRVDHAEADRVFAHDIAKLYALIHNYELVEMANATAQEVSADLNGKWQPLVDF